jgi:hypothetical protein
MKKLLLPLLVLSAISCGGVDKHPCDWQGGSIEPYAAKANPDDDPYIDPDCHQDTNGTISQ